MGQSASSVSDPVGCQHPVFRLSGVQPEVLQIEDEVKVLIKDVDIDLETVSLDRWALNPGVPVLVRIIDTDTVVERIGLHMRHLPEDDIAN